MRAILFPLLFILPKISYIFCLILLDLNLLYRKELCFRTYKFTLKNTIFIKEITFVIIIY